MGLPEAKISLRNLTWASLRVAVLVLRSVSHAGQAPVAGLRVGTRSLADAETQLTVPGAG